MTGFKSVYLLAVMGVFAFCFGQSDIFIASEVEPPVELGAQPDSGNIAMPEVAHVQSYTVVRGDTLWDICNEMLGNPWYWPTLWQNNSHIQNPHLIYPGDILHFDAGSNRHFPSITIENKAQNTEQLAPIESELFDESSETRSVRSFLQERSKYIYLRPNYFFHPRKVTGLGQVAFAPENKLQLSDGDRVFIKPNKNNASQLKLGQQMFAIEEVDTVYKNKRFNTGKKWGYIYRKDAVLELTAFKDDVIEAQIISSDFGIERGFQVIPANQKIVRIEPKKVDNLIQAEIVAVDHGQLMIADGDYILLKKTRDSSTKWKVGTLLSAYRNLDPMLNKETNYLRAKRVLGTVFIVESYASYALAYVLNVNDALSIGDRLSSKAMD